MLSTKYRPSMETNLACKGPLLSVACGADLNVWVPAVYYYFVCMYPRWHFIK
jgi:hypothetical protein